MTSKLPTNGLFCPQELVLVHGTHVPLEAQRQVGVGTPRSWRFQGVQPSPGDGLAQGLSLKVEGSEHSGGWASKLAACPRAMLN